jgi:hypothetical protein
MQKLRQKLRSCSLTGLQKGHIGWSRREFAVGLQKEVPSRPPKGHVSRPPK